MTNRTALLGSWKLVSIQQKLSDNGEIIDRYGADPLGFCWFHPCVRMIMVITSSGPRNTPGLLAAKRACHVEDDALVVQVDVATYPSQAGQSRDVPFIWPWIL